MTRASLDILVCKQCLGMGGATECYPGATQTDTQNKGKILLFKSYLLGDHLHRLIGFLTNGLKSMQFI